MSSDNAVNTSQKPAPGALTDAIKRGNMTAVIALLEQEADVNEKEEDTGTTPLIMAACHDRTEIIPLLLDRGATIDEKDNEGFTAMLRAVFHKNEASACLLIERGADVDQKNNCNSTALIYASRRNRLKTVRMLIDYGARIDEKDIDDNTALSVAENAAFTEIIQALEEAPPLEQRLAQRAAREAEAASRASHVIAVERQARLRAVAPRFKIKPAFAL